MSAQIEGIRSSLSNPDPHRWWKAQQLQPASLDEVIAWESLHQITLPEAYRRFITEVANGVVAEPCELYSLEQWWNHLVSPEDPERQRLWPSRPCLLRESLQGKKDWRKLLAGDQLQIDGDTRKWPVWAGTIALSDEGCGSLAVLIMTGDLRGRVCHLDFMNAPVFSPQANFLDWYEARLNGAPW